MNMNIIDCRNQACPAPVINVKKALEEYNELQVLLDDGAPRENVTRFSRNRGYSVSEQTEGNGWRLTISGTGTTAQCAISTPAGRRSVILITSDRLGDGPEELGRLLMKNFIHTLLETRELPAQILFANTGVFLTCEGSDACEALTKLTEMGVEVLSCGLCLDFFKMKDKLSTGTTTNMLAIAESLLSAGSVIKL